MSRPQTFLVEVPHVLEDEGTPLLVTGNVTLGGRWPIVEDLSVRHARTQDDLEFLADWVIDSCEQALIAEAEALWRTP